MPWPNMFGCGCCGEPVQILCTPCDIPAADLVLTWYYWQVHYGGPYGTTYTAAGPISTPLIYTPPPLVGDHSSGSWSSGWFLGPDDSSTCNTPPIGAPGDCCYLNFNLTCSHAGGTTMQIGLSSYAGPTRPGLGDANCGNIGAVFAKVGPATFTCDPFLIEYECAPFLPGGSPCYVGYLFAGGVVTP